MRDEAEKDGSHGAAAAAVASEGAVTSDSITTMAPVRLNRVSLCESERPACLLFPVALLRELPSVRKNCLATTVFFFFLMCVNGLRQIFSGCKRREQFLGQYIETKMEYLTMEKYFSFSDVRI